MFLALGRQVNNFFTEWGLIVIFFVRVIRRSFSIKKNFRRSIHQMVDLGVNSLGITVITAAFVGMAFAVQVVREFLRFGAGDMIGGVVALAVWRELGPLLTGVVIAGRVGAAISAELGSMKVTEQVEALEAMGQDPLRYLVVPRVIACAYMMPLLVGLADIVGFFGGFAVATWSGRINPYAYFNSAQTMLYPQDIVGGLVKAFIFGVFIAVISCYMGLKATAGAKSVGDMTTRAVVVSLVTIFILNYFLSVVLF